MNKRRNRDKKPAYAVLVGPVERQIGGEAVWFPSDRTNRADAVMYLTDAYYRGRGEQYNGKQIPAHYEAFCRDVEMMGGLTAVITRGFRVVWRKPSDDDESVDRNTG